jgi:hypothetical protein
MRFPRTRSAAVLRALEDLSERQRQSRRDHLRGYEKALEDISLRNSIAPQSWRNPKQEEDVKTNLNGRREQVRVVEASQNVLRSLTYKRMHDREERIPASHAETFAWIFDDDELDFTRWASRSNGTFTLTILGLVYWANAEIQAYTG